MRWPQLRIGSLSGRLTLAFAATAVVLLAASAGAMYGVLVEIVHRQANLFLSDKINVLRVILAQRPGDMEALREEVQWEVGSRRHDRYFSRVIDAGGKVILETPGMAETIAAAPFPDPTPPDREWTGGMLWNAGGERYYLLGTAQAREGGPTGPLRLLQVALDLSQQEDILEDYRHGMAISLLAGIALAALLARGAARSGLRPLADITRETQAITPGKLNRRIAGEAWPSEVRELAVAFNAMLARLDGAFNRLSTFSADLAHDLRTPLNNCLGEVEVALSKPRSTEEYRQILESNLEELRRLARMVDSLLFLARADNAQAQLEKAWIEVDDAFEAVAAAYEHLADEQDVRLERSGRGRVWADPSLLRRALSNLLANALAHTSAGGRVELTSTIDAAGACTLLVHDSGSGIRPEELPNLFQRFHRSPTSRSRHPQGLGLGLAIVKSIMDLHDGTAEVSSVYGDGTTVALRFPPGDDT